MKRYLFTLLCIGAMGLYTTDTVNAVECNDCAATVRGLQFETVDVLTECSFDLTLYGVIDPVSRPTFEGGGTYSSYGPCETPTITIDYSEELGTLNWDERVGGLKVIALPPVIIRNTPEIITGISDSGCQPFPSELLAVDYIENSSGVPGDSRFFYNEGGIDTLGNIANGAIEVEVSTTDAREASLLSGIISSAIPYRRQRIESSNSDVLAIDPDVFVPESTLVAPDSGFILLRDTPVEYRDGFRVYDGAQTQVHNTCEGIARHINNRWLQWNGGEYFLRVDEWSMDSATGPRQIVQDCILYSGSYSFTMREGQPFTMNDALLGLQYAPNGSCPRVPPVSDYTDRVTQVPFEYILDDTVYATVQSTSECPRRLASKSEPDGSAYYAIVLMCDENSDGVNPTPPPEPISTPFSLPNTSGIQPLGRVTIPILIGRIIQILVGIFGSITLIMVVYGGVLMMLGGTGGDKFKKGTSIILWSSLAFVVLIASYGIIQFVFQIIG